MITEISAKQILEGIAVAAQSLSARKEEVNRLNVFPVPDGDTGTNMSLTMKSVMDNVAKLSDTATAAERCKAITTGALMGARGNSGVITSQILRGLCEGCTDKDSLDVPAIDAAFSSAVDVAFKAVRKPVKGTILTVLEDTAAAAKFAAKKKMALEEALDYIVQESYASVERTPEFLPVLKENGVVDAGGFGLAIIIDSFVASVLGKSTIGADVAIATKAAPKVEIEQINDWEGSKYRYCNEFLVDSDTLDINETLDFLQTMGDCELCVGAIPKFKVHVHSNTPDKVLAYFLARGQISEVFIHNMQLQSADRNEKLAAEKAQEPLKPTGVVAVAPGSGNAAILEGLGVDVVVSGGQTMNPSTADLLEAVEKCHAEKVLILPNNSNIIMAAQTASELAEIPVGVVPTKSVPAAFSALFAFDPDASLDENIEAMSEVLPDIHIGEVTTAVKESKDAHGNPIKAGDVIGIADNSIEAVGDSIESVAMKLLEVLEAEDYDTLTLLAGEDYTDEAFEAFTSEVEEKYEDVEVDPHRGEQPLYPLIFSLE